MKCLWLDIWKRAPGTANTILFTIVLSPCLYTLNSHVELRIGEQFLQINEAVIYIRLKEKTIR